MHLMPTADDLRALFDYDPATGDLRWRIRKAQRVHTGSIAGCQTVQGYRSVEVGGRGYRVHRVIWCMVTGQWPANQVDHVNRIRDDNRWCNLREATNSENQHNISARARNTSGHKGVCREGTKWRARISHDGRREYLGSFETAEQAREAYQKASAHYHGEFGRVE